MRGAIRFCLFIAVAVAGALGAAACDDINKPAYVPKSEPRTTCFSDVECPGSKCIKSGGNDIQGHCASGTSGPGALDGGAVDDAPRDAALAPPAFKPAPGDIQL